MAESGLTYFLDTSALAKLYHHEAGSELAEAWAADDTMLLWISDLARAELHSALIWKVREGELTEEVLHGISECFREHRDHLPPVLISDHSQRWSLRGPSICSSSMERDILRGSFLDALQLASAQAVMGKG